MSNREEFAIREPKIIGEESYKQFAVLIPILHTSKGNYILFEKRSAKLRRQPGEICFPGGKVEKDETFKECAIRETMEELLLERDQIKVHGPGDIYLSPFHLILHTFIGDLINYKDTLSTDEVEEVIKIPYDFFLNNQPKEYKSRLISEPPEDFPYEWIPNGENYPWAKGSQEILFYKYENHVIWGMTAQIVKSAVNLMKQYNLIT